MGEELNLGILFVFPERECIEFYYPKSLSRLQRAYPGASENLIKSYLISFGKKSPELSKYLKPYNFDLDRIVYEHLLIKDSSSLQFSEFNHAIFSGDPDKAKAKYIDLYLGLYTTPKALTKKKTDREIISEIKGLVNAKKPEIAVLLKSKDTILKNNHISFKTDFYWQNGTKNFVKGVSFDFEKEETIIEKSLLIDNQLKHLQKEIDRTNSRVDLLVSKPSNQKLNGAFEEAISILKEENDYRLTFEEGQFENYADKIVSEIDPNI